MYKNMAGFPRKEKSGMRKLFVLLLAMMLLLSAADAEENESEPYSYLATEDDVMKTASQAFASPWMPRDIKITASPENGLWVVRAQQKDTDEQLAIMQIDCDNDECIVYYRLSSYELPSLNHIRYEISNDSKSNTRSGSEWAEEIFRAYRGGFESSGKVIGTVDLKDQCRLFAIGTQDTADAVLIAKIPETQDASPTLLAYVDFSCNWEVRYDGYISLGEAYRIANEACLQRFEELDPEDSLVLDDSAFVLFDSDTHYEGSSDLTNPVWIILLVDQRADPSLELFDPSVEFFRYPVLVNPENGEIELLPAPETFGV